MTFDPHKPCRTRDGREATYLGRTQNDDRYAYRFEIPAKSGTGASFQITIARDGSYFNSARENLFDLENYTPEPKPPAFDPTKPVQTRDGRAARILCTDRKGTGVVADYPIIALVQDSAGEECAQPFTIEGRKWKYPPAGDPSNGDLVNTPEERQAWVVSYFTSVGALEADVYWNENHAREWAQHRGERLFSCTPVMLREGDKLP